MAPSSLLLLLLTPLLFISVVDSSSQPEDLVAELLSLQSQSDSGVIRLDDHKISRFLTSTKAPRPYSLLIFFDAKQLHEKSELRLQDIHHEFSLLASSFITNNADGLSGSHGKLFFCDIEFKEAQSTFSLFGVNALPHIRLIGPNVKNPKDSEAMDHGDLSRTESMADFVESKTKLSVGPIHRPPIVSRNQMAFVIVILLIWFPFMIKKVLSGKTLLHDWRIWLGGAIFVYFFSVSGAMHNIIRKMPMFLASRDDPNKLVFFYQGSGMQLGAEGFAIGSMYTIVGLLLAFVTHWLVKVKSVTEQRTLMLIALGISVWAVTRVIRLDSWKTGYAIHTFWPSSWN